MNRMDGHARRRMVVQEEHGGRIPGRARSLCLTGGLLLSAVGMAAPARGAIAIEARQEEDILEQQEAAPRVELVLRADGAVVVGGGRVQRASPTANFHLLVDDARQGPPDEAPPRITMGHLANLLGVLQRRGIELPEDWQVPPWGGEERAAEDMEEFPLAGNSLQGEVPGIGGPSRYVSRISEHRKQNAPGRKGTERALKDGLEWLRKHQDEDGKWDADGFAKHDLDDARGDRDAGPGQANHDIGLTALALLAFLGDGHSTAQGEYKAAVAMGIAWLRRQQDPASGVFGREYSPGFLYGHALATLAMAEAYEFSRSPLLKRNVGLAVRYIEGARHPKGVWHSDVPGAGDNDTSITGWMILALLTARDAGFTVDPAALEGTLAWLDEVTDPATGRCGYDTFGSPSSRAPENEHFPREKGEAMTAVALLSRFFLGQQPAEIEVMEKHAALLLRHPPGWDIAGRGCDMYYWYHGTYAMYQMGGNNWTAWNREMKKAVVEHQRRDGAARGSWDPVGPWGYAGGRIYSTAMMALCLEAYFRYDRLTEAR